MKVAARYAVRADEESAAIPSWARSKSNPNALKYVQIPDAYFDVTLPALFRAKHRKAALILGIVIRESCTSGSAEWITLPIADFADRCGASCDATEKALQILVAASLLEIRPSAMGMRLSEYRVNLAALDAPGLEKLEASGGAN